MVLRVYVASINQRSRLSSRPFKYELAGGMCSPCARRAYILCITKPRGPILIPAIPPIWQAAGKDGEDCGGVAENASKGRSSGGHTQYTLQPQDNPVTTPSYATNGDEHRHGGTTPRVGGKPHPRKTAKTKQQDEGQQQAWVTGFSSGVGALFAGGDGEGCPPLPERRAAEVGAAGWSRMTVAMPTDHSGAFHGMNRMYIEGGGGGGETLGEVGSWGK